MSGALLIPIFIVPMALFLIFVAPVWLFLHYRGKKQLDQGLTAEEHQQLTALITQAQSMAIRIETLESILDVESPDWRTKQ